MGRRASVITQADVARTLRAAKQAGLAASKFVLIASEGHRDPRKGIDGMTLNLALGSRGHEGAFEV